MSWRIGRLYSRVRKLAIAVCAAGALLTTGSCSVNRIDRNHTQAPYASFVFVKGDAPVTELTVCEPDEHDDCVVIEDKDGLHITGSGVAVANSVVHRERQYVMTAGHVCDVVDRFRRGARAWWKKEHNKDVTSVELTLTVRIRDNDGDTHIGKVIGLNANRDICVLAVQDTKLPIVTIADDYPEVGARIFNLAAPLGSWQPGMTHRFDGYYSGPYRCDKYDAKYGILDTLTCKVNEHVISSFALAATGGSSGSPVFNWDGELIGIISMSATNFPHVTFAVRIEDMVELLAKVMEFEASPEGLAWDPDFDTPDSVTGATVKIAPDAGSGETRRPRLRYRPE